MALPGEKARLRAVLRRPAIHPRWWEEWSPPAPHPFWTRETPVPAKPPAPPDPDDQPCGPGRRFTPAQIRAIRRDYRPHDRRYSGPMLAAAYGVTPKAILDVVNRVSYRDVV